jgi:hypothetical protein
LVAEALLDQPEQSVVICLGGRNCVADLRQRNIRVHSHVSIPWGVDVSSRECDGVFSRGGFIVCLFTGDDPFAPSDCPEKEDSLTLDVNRTPVVSRPLDWSVPGMMPSFN